MTTNPAVSSRSRISITPVRWRATTRQHLMTLLVGFWLMIGIFVDGWAHNHLGGTLETFFTPWHAIFYSGFLATALWIGWLGQQGVRQGRRGLAAFPDGYELGAIGVMVFALGGLCDMIWHTLFGIEVGIDALLSPTHLLLFLGAELLVLSPLVACWRAPTSRRVSGQGVWPAVLSMTAALSFASFMHMYAWALVDLPNAASYDGARSLLTSTLLTGLMLSAPVLLLHTTGARSGLERVNPMMYLQDGGRTFVFASKGGADTHPDWYHNLVAHPEVTVELGAQTFAAEATPVSSEERARIYAIQARRYPGFAEYEAKTTRVIPVVELVRSS